MSLSPNANRACRIGPNFTVCWIPCFIHYYILALNSIKKSIKIKNKNKKSKNQSKIYISLFKSDSLLFGVIPSRKDCSFSLLKSESLFFDIFLFFYIFYFKLSILFNKFIFSFVFSIFIPLLKRNDTKL